MGSVSDSSDSLKKQNKRLRTTSAVTDKDAVTDAVTYYNAERGSLALADWALPAAWREETENFASHDGKIDLFATKYKSDTPKNGAALFVLHGLGEHGARYRHFPRYLQHRFDEIYCLDHRGHGRSGGARGHVDEFDDFARDAAIAIRRYHLALSGGSQPKQKTPKIHLFGHSLGGLIALRSCMLNSDLPLSSVVLSAPFLGMAVNVSVYKKLAAHVLSKILPRLALKTGLDASLLSHEPAVVDAYLRDPLVHGVMTPSFYISMIEKLRDTLARRSLGGYPALFLVPLADKIVDPRATLEFCEKLVGEKKLRTFEGFYHEIANETGRAEVFAEINNWIEEGNR